MILRDLDVLEVGGRTSARIAGELLARLGATVRRVDLGRSEAGLGGLGEHPVIGDREEVMALAWDRGKTVQVARPDDAELAPLLARADVLLTSGEAGRSVLPPHLLDGFDGVHAHLSPFGLTGPYSGFRGTELNAAAFGGLSTYFGEAGREPLAPPVMVGTYQAALAATIGVLAAVQADPPTRTLDIAEYEVLATNVISALYSLAFFHGPILRRIGRRRPNPYPYSILPCKDGWVTLVFLPGQQWQRLLAVMGNPEWSTDPRLKSRRAIAEHHYEEVDAHVSAWLGQYTKAELRDMATQEDLPFGPLQTVDELLADRQLHARGFLRAHATGGRRVELPGLPLHFTSVPAANGAPPPPRRPPRPTDLPTAPLAGKRVVDLGWVLSGPMVTQILGDLGADVIRVESHRYRDTLRRGLPLIATDVEAGDAGETPNLMPHFNNANRGKRSLIVNLRSDAGKQVLRRLIAGADVVVENLGARSLERLGVTMEDLHALRPGLVIVRISMAGQDGPDAAIPGFAPQATALAGLDGLTGYAGEEPIGMVAGTLGDIIPALFGTASALAALRRATETGEGATIDLSMLEANAMPLEPLLADRELGGAAPVPRGNEHAVYAPHGMFRCQGEDEWVSIAVRDQAEWRSLCALVGAPADAADLTGAQRRERAADTTAWIEAWTNQRSAEAAFHALQGAGVAAAPALGAEDLLVDPHAAEREDVVGLEHHLMGYLPVYGSPLHAEPPMSSVHTRAPDLGEHTEEVLAELGFSAEEIAELEAGDAFDGQPARAG